MGRKITGLTILLALGAAAVVVWRYATARPEAVRETLNRAQQQFNNAATSVGLSSRVATPNYVPSDENVPGVLNLADENLTTTQRIRTKFGHNAELSQTPHINVNVEGRGVAYLRGYVHTEQQRQAAESIAASTEGVSSVVNDLNIEQANNL